MIAFVLASRRGRGANNKLRFLRARVFVASRAAAARRINYVLSCARFFVVSRRGRGARRGWGGLEKHRRCSRLRTRWGHAWERARRASR